MAESSSTALSILPMSLNTDAFLRQTAYVVGQLVNKYKPDRYRQATRTAFDESDSRNVTNQETLQPVLVSLNLVHDTRRTALADELSHSIDYSAISTSLASYCASSPIPSLEVLSDRVAECCFELYANLERLSLVITRPHVLLHGDSTAVECERTRDAHGPSRERYLIRDLQCQTIVGINPCERAEAQRVCLDIILTRSKRNSRPFDFRGLARRVFHHVQSSSCFTLEALTSSVAHTALLEAGNDTDSVTVRAAKPSALPLARAAEVEISRTLRDFQHHAKTYGLESVCSQPRTTTKAGLFGVVPHPSLSSLLGALQPRNTIPYKHTAALALGANLGDRFANIELALRLLEAPTGGGNGPPKAAVINTSFMYETAPMYVTNQPRFINCACMIETDMEPMELLHFVKEVENTVGRVTSFRNGPRAIDVDILTYDTLVIDSRPETERANLDNLANQLVVPHPRIAEREFVLRPVNDMMPDFVHPTLGKPIRSLLAELLASHPQNVDPMYKVMPFPRYPLPTSPEERPSSPTLASISPVPPTAIYWKFPPSASNRNEQPKTRIMGTLNATPDSFSDGSLHNTIPAAIAYVKSSMAGGADIIDVGGYSTRPRAEYVPPEEEVSRVVPVIQAIRNAVLDEDEKGTASSAAEIADVLISVDTFRADVASAAVLAGANCINDVYAFTGPDYPLTTVSAEHFLTMRAVARNLAVPVILMHSRGEASANRDYSAYAYAADANGRGAVLEGVRVELGDKIEAAVKGRGGIRRWLVMVDPGIGFSKSVEGNLELLRGAKALTYDDIVSNPLAGYPQLIGTSRKSFLGAILAREDPEGPYAGRETRPDERGWATAAAVSCAIQQKAAVVRVHDVLELGDVIRVGLALWD
ncbi:hypothetical protein IEO21_08364 [Rhodonia placenta]|uniref:Pterin-binding domain-containing protein n=1 Tax=Rhodonia placenta TaxID=104341 RepID=A0A8H7NWF0_9APHY|nr:hypothetical protein IEO21_08364 [Postia placenta]